LQAVGRGGKTGFSGGPKKFDWLLMVDFESENPLQRNPHPTNNLPKLR